MNRKTYITPRMEVFKIESTNLLSSSPDPIYGGGGSGNADAPMMPDFDEFEDQFDFTDIKLW